MTSAGYSSRSDTAARICIGAAAVIATYLSLLALSRSPLPGCGTGSSCGEVLSSRWAYLFGVPVSSAGLALYCATLLLAAAWSGGRRDLNAALCGLCLAAVVTGAVWFIGVQALVLKSFCPWCTGAHLLALTGAALLVQARRRSLAGDEADAPPLPRRMRHWKKLAAPALSTAVLWTGAYLGPDRATAVRSSTVPGTVQVQESGRSLTLHQGNFRFTLSELPFIGDRRTENCAALLSDYTCDYCRRMHRTLNTFCAESPGQSVALIPAWRNPQGRAVQATMLVLFHADAEAWQTLSRRLIEGETAATPDTVGREAVALAGHRKFSEASAVWGKRIDALLDHARALQNANLIHSPGGHLPQLMAGEQILTGLEEDKPRLTAFFRSNAGRTGEGTATPGMTPPVPSLVVRPDADAGTVKPGQTVLVHIPLENQGAGPLQPGWCELPQGLTLHAMPVSEVHPGSTGIMTLAVKAPASPGPFRRVVRLHTNLPEPATLTVIGNVAETPLAPAGNSIGSARPLPGRAVIRSSAPE